MRAPRLTVKRARDLRGRMTLPEQVLWRRLSGKQLLGSRWRKQHPMGPYILDFYCPAAKLCVEVDGADHVWRTDGHDERRTTWLAERGVRVLRFPAREVLNDRTLASVLETIADALTELNWERGAAAAPSTPACGGGPPPPLRG